MTWPASKRRLWADILSEQVSKEQQINRVEQAYANATAIMKPDKLNKLLPSDESPGQRLPMTDEEKKGAVERAEEIREKDWSGSWKSKQ